MLSRPDGTVQVGWDPRRAVIVHPPSGLPARILVELLCTLQSTATVAELHTLAAGHDADESVITALITRLVNDGVVTVVARHRGRSAAIPIHGSGPLSDLLSASLRCSGVRISQSNRTHACAEGADLALLTDYLVADPRVVRDLHDAAVPHLAVRVRDGTGLIGPLVIPGVTSCLRCADLHRSDRDNAWPAIAAQLCGTVGTADRATVLATAALALTEVDHVVRAVRGNHSDHGGHGDHSDHGGHGDHGDHAPPVGTGAAPAVRAARPASLDTTLEFDVAKGAIVARRWSRHVKCTC